MKENPTVLDALQDLVECFELYDQYNEAIKTIESITKSEADFDFKFNVSILLSRMEGKQKLYDNAKKRLSDFLITLESNSSHQNYLIFKTLGDIFKKQGELHMACFLYELSLNYEPTDSDLRFTLAYDGYGEIKKHALAAYHYKAYLNTNEGPVALNNLGIEYENLKLLGKSVSALKRAESLHETLANANLSRMYIEKGFYDEAENILIKALEKKGYNKNVDYYLNNLKASKEQEEENEKKLLEEIKGYKDFALEFAKAISIPFDKYGEINGLWVTDYGELQEFKIQFDAPHKLTGEHEEEILTTSGLLAALAGSKQESEKRIKKFCLLER